LHEGKNKVKTPANKVKQSKTKLLFFWGIFTTPVKAPAVQLVHLHGVVFQLLMSLSIFASSCIVLTFTDFVWTWLGFSGGCLWACGNLCGIFAIHNCGIATAQGVWAGAICVVSFFWGWLGQSLWANECILSDLPLAFTGLGILVGGIALVTYFTRPTNNDIEPTTAEYVLANDGESDIEAIKGPKQNRAKGLMFAISYGLFAGSIFVPLKFDSAEGFETVFSFGTGILCTSVFWYFVSLVVVQDRDTLSLHFMQVSPYCMLSGVLWNVGNISSIIATQSSLGLTIAYPIMQNAMVISGIIGIVVFKEIQGRERIIGFAGSIVVISVGVLLLGTYAACK